MVKCPECGKTLKKPEKSLKNWFFHLEAYKCDGCGARFEIEQ